LTNCPKYYIPNHQLNLENKGCLRLFGWALPCQQGANNQYLRLQSEPKGSKEKMMGKNLNPNPIGVDAAKLAGLQVDLLQKLRSGKITMLQLEEFLRSEDKKNVSDLGQEKLEFEISPTGAKTTKDLLNMMRQTKIVDEFFVKELEESFNISGWGNSDILPENNRRIILVSFGEKMTVDQANEEGRKRGLEQPTIQEAFLYALQCLTTLGKERRIIVPHKAIRGKYGACHLYFKGQRLCLGLHNVPWKPEDYFLFIQL